jgi:N-methylhydantoinase A/oxoprolinase/acetone carboxylase beta subunit
MSDERLHVIACGVLGLDLKAVLKERGLAATTEYLPGGLHNTPHLLRERLQERIDAISARGEADRIAIGYGVCGLGAAGLHARTIPLAIPRVHDCIALFLGSDAAYRDQFARYPGTYYLAAGWVEEGTEPLSQCRGEQPRHDADASDPHNFAGLYGQENSDAIRHFLNSWQRNYQRAVFIDTGVATRRDTYAAMARAMASSYGWQYEELPGSHDLLLKLLTASATTDDILVVPPGYVTVYDPAARGLRALPPSEAVRVAGPAERHLVLDEAPHAAGVTANLGLGIDAGGTYTDAVIFDFAAGRILAKAKAPTTKWDLIVGVRQAIERLDAAYLGRVNLVSVSTTLATNAIVEGRGQKVGLLLMPPYGRMEHSDFTHSPIAVIRGQLEIDGTERQPVDAEQVRQVVRTMLERHHVEAFAIAGYASHANPDHERAVRAIVRETTHLPVTCGHEISEGLNYRIKAETAALNARIIPCLASLLEKVEAVLGERGLHVPTMVVKSDGSLMSIPTALERPIETILSGPAASVAGARRLTGRTDAIVVDIGGTTTDTATLCDGRVEVCEDGAAVGGWRTHVRALNMRTLGLGGDSLVNREAGTLVIGPRRVMPVCRLAGENPAAARAIDWIEAHIDLFEESTHGMEILALNPDACGEPGSDAEQRIVAALREGPCCLRELAARLGSHAWRTLPVEALENTYRIQRCGLTPTDALHADGTMQMWDAESARRICAVFARLARLEAERFTTMLRDGFCKRLAVELLKKELPATVDPDSLDASAVARALVDNALDGGSAGLAVAFTLKQPVIGIGAPAGQFLPAAAAALHTEAIIPEHADVANAVGAITSPVLIRRRAMITTDETGEYAVAGAAGAPRFKSLDAATTFAVNLLKQTVRELARQAGTRETRVDVDIGDNIGTVSDGSGLFLGRTLEARLAGLPDLALVAGGVTQDVPAGSSLSAGPEANMT